MVEQHMDQTIQSRSRQLHHYHNHHHDHTSLDNNNNNSILSFGSYSPELPKIAEEEVKDITYITYKHHDEIKKIGFQDPEELKKHDSEDSEDLIVFGDCSNSQETSYLEFSGDDFRRGSINGGNSLETLPSTLSVDDISSTDSQFSSIAADDTIDVTRQSSPDLLSLKSASQSLDVTPKTDKNHRQMVRQSTPVSKTKLDVKRELFKAGTPVKTETSQYSDISKQFKVNMKKLKNGSINNKKDSITRVNKAPIPCLKSTLLQYHMTKPTNQKQQTVSKRESRFGGKRNKRFQSYTPNSRDERNDFGDNIFQCKSCGMRFRFLFNLTSHFVLVHNLIREEDDNIPNIISKYNVPSPVENNKLRDSKDSSSNLLEEVKSEEYYRKLLLYGNKTNLHFCEICEKFFKFEVNLNTHKRTIHAA